MIEFCSELAINVLHIDMQVMHEIYDYQRYHHLFGDVTFCHFLCHFVLFRPFSFCGVEVTFSSRTPSLFIVIIIKLRTMQQNLGMQPMHMLILSGGTVE